MRKKPGDRFNEALVMNGHGTCIMTSLNKAPRELCRIKKAVKALIKKNPDGMTHLEICIRLQQQSLFLGTYRNLLSQASSALRLLTEEGVVISKGTGSLKIFIYSHLRNPIQRRIEDARR